MAEKKKRERPGFKRDSAAAMSKHYRDVQTNKPMAYALMSSNPLVEVAYAAGIQPAFPENYACVCAARHASEEYCETAEALIAGTIWATSMAEVRALLWVA